MIFGLTFEKLLLIGVLAAFIIGPEKLPGYAEKFARFIRSAGQYMRGAKDRMREEVGPELDDLDWRKLDPRQYDPRRIIRDALLDDTPAASAPKAVAPATPTRTAEPPREFSAENPPPFDPEAT